MRFATPVALLLLLVLPLFAWMGWPRLTYRRRRDVISLVLRLLIVLFLILGLAGLQTVEAADKLAVIFLFDASDSIDQAERAQAETYIRDALSQMTPDDQAGIVVFGKNALVERPVSVSKDFQGILSAPVRLDTNIAEAIRLGMAMFPSGMARRLVILSDGVETLGNAMEAARLAAATNIQIDVVPLHRQAGPEVLVSDVRLPTRLNEGQTFDLGVTVESTVAAKANLSVLSAGAVIQTTTVDLKVGTNDFVLSLRAPSQGFTDFQVRVDSLLAANDTYYQNNELSGFTEVTGPPRVLIITSKPEEVAALLPAMQQAGLTVDVKGPSDLPIGLAPLAGYKAVVLANVSATDLTDQRMKTLQSFVRDLGGGLVVIGGPNSYGVGGYYQTPLEETLPVDVQIKDQRRIPSLTMVYVIDRSGSMEIIGPSGVTNLELSKEAARRSLEFLYERDRAGVLSFDTDPQWLVPIQYVANRDAMVSQIGSLRPGGGTDILAAVKEVARTLPSDPSNLKHVILLTDGGSDPGNVVEITRQMHDQYGITVTAIGIGVGVPAFMRDIAVAGHGTYYELVDLQTIPQIFAAETVLATRSYIVEQELAPIMTANSPIMRGITSMPTLKGYVATTPKPTATVILTSPVSGYNDPLLASWQYGLGRVVAWTSDATTRWAANWVGWDGFQRFWSQAIRSTIVEGLNSNLETRVEQRNGQWVLVAEARNDSGALINGLNLDASVVDPRLNNQSIKLQQVAPGVYEAPIDPQREGAYFIRVAGSTPDSSIGVAQTTGWVLSYSPEYRLRDTNTSLLGDIARLTGGQDVSSQSRTVLRHDIREERAATSLWPWLLLLATLLLPFDIAVRRLIITQSDLQKMRDRLRELLGVRPQGAPQVSSARMVALKEAKERATSTLPAVTPIDASPVPRRSNGGSHPGQPPAKRAEPPPEPVSAPSALASRLAERRRQRKEED